MELFAIKNLCFKYPLSRDNAVNGVSFTVNSGEFIVVCGASGCGKTTLLKLLKRELTPNGDMTGEILYKGVPLSKLDKRTCAAEIGFVMQDPESQIVTDKVWHELAFGLESLGMPNEVIRRKVGEMASYFGINEWFRKNTDELSGGQKQLLNLASVMAMSPSVILLDEPTGQLDPIAASGFFSTIKKLNRDLGLTVIMVEHRLEEVFPMADKVMVMENGTILTFDAPSSISENLKKLRTDHPMTSALPTAVRIFDASGVDDVCPITVGEGRAFLEKHFENKKAPYHIPERRKSTETAIETDNVWFRYGKNDQDVLRGTTVKIYKGEFFCILGGNGAGKTTLLNVVSALDMPYRGKIKIHGRNVKDFKGNSLYKNGLAYLPQDPATVFVKDSVRKDLEEILSTFGYPKEQISEKIKSIAEKTKITQLLDKHPYDISGGEQQKCALAKILLTEPRILLLDEPTKGLDAFSKSEIGKFLTELKSGGMTVVAVTHDVEFAASFADRCGLFFDGELLSTDAPERFFSDNSFYTTAADRIARDIFPGAVTAEQVITMCKGALK